MPQVSIITPAYNPGRYLAEAIDSVIAQSFTDWEMVVVDDGSTEDFSWVGDKHSNIRLIRQENRGLSVARNVAIIASQGKYIAFLDADDVWLPTKLGKQVAVMEESPRAAFCQTQFEMIDEKGTFISAGYARPILSYVEMLQGCSICISSVLLRRECLAVSSLFDPFLKSSQDFDMWLKLSRFYDIAFVPSCETLYRWHSQNMSHNYRGTYAETKRLFHSHIRLAHETEDQAALMEAKAGLRRAHATFSAQAFDYSRASLRQRRIKPFVLHLAFAFQSSPSYVTRSIFSHIARSH